MQPLRFELHERYLSERLGGDLMLADVGHVTVVESPLRTRRDGRFSFIRSVWWIWLPDGRSMLSVPIGTGKAVSTFAAGVAPEQLLRSKTSADLLSIMSVPLRQYGLGNPSLILRDLCFVWPNDKLPALYGTRCRLLRNLNIPLAEGLSLPPTCDPAGLAYGVVEDGQVVALAFAHKTGIMEKSVAEVGVITAEPYRGRGHAQAALSLLVRDVLQRDGVVRYECDPDNAASIAVARKVDLAEYGMSLQFINP